MSIKLRVSSSVIGFKEKALKAWGLEEREVSDFTSDTVFFGLYHLNDWRTFMKCKGKRYVCWCGGDIQNLKKGYAYSDGEGLEKSKKYSFIPWHWIFRVFKAEHYCENEIEQEELRKLGIESIVVPSFLEDIDDFPVSFKTGKKKVFLSGRPGREVEYGFHIAKLLAELFPEMEFHLDGSKLGIKNKNVIEHGSVSNEQFNKDIKNYHCGLRTNSHDGFSEITAKSILMGQWPISRIKYSHISNYETLVQLVVLVKELERTNKPNIEGRDYYRKLLNNYPWVKQL